MMKTILCYGDSNTYGYDPETKLRYPKDIRWPGRLQILLGDDYSVIEEGCNGRTTIHDDPIDGWKNGLDYLKPCLNSHKPIDIFILMLGINDLKETFHLTAEQSAGGVAVLIDVIQAFTAQKQKFVPQIIIVSPPEIGPGIASSPFGVKFTEEAIKESEKLSPCYRTVAEEKGCLFLDAAQLTKSSEKDSIHLTADGHKALASGLCDLIIRANSDN